MKVGFLGFPFVDSNKGCEALTYSMVQILRSLSSRELTIVNLNGQKVDNIKRHFKDINFESRELIIKDYRFKNPKILKDLDFVIDATYGDNFSDIYLPWFVKKTTILKIIIWLNSKPLILAPQTYGPFKDKRLEKMASFIIKKANAVYSRDELSTQYVKKISNITPITVTDLAFILPYTKQSTYCEKIKIGINVSGLLWDGGFSESNQFGLKTNYREYIVELLSYLTDSDKYMIYIIPHVLATPDMQIDDDVAICEELSQQFGLKLAPKFENPVQAKSFISNMDIFTGARMHSTIAAISSGVATIPFSYSRKFEGLYDSINYKYVIDGKTLSTDEAVKKTKEYISMYQKLISDAEISMEQVHYNHEKFILDFTNTIKKYID